MLETILSIIFASLSSGNQTLLSQIEAFSHFSNETASTKDEMMIEPIITAQSAVVLDMETGDILFEKNPNEKMEIASLTKLMTTHIILEENKIEEITKVSPNAANQTGSRMGLYANEEITIKNLLLGSLINSGNDASTALAEHNAGSVSAFVDKMNKKANELSLYNTQFKNPTGIDQEGHFSSAMDIAKLSRIVYENEFLKETVKTKNIVVENINGKISHRLSNTNDLLDSYLTVLGLKTGTTPMAGQCFAAITKLPNEKLILSVVLSSTNRFKDSKILVDWTNRAYFLTQ